MENKEKHFITGFNNGYLLAKHEPELVDMLVKSTNTQNEYFQGLVSGKLEYDLEKTRQHSKDLSHDKTLNKDIEDKERDR